MTPELERATFVSEELRVRRFELVPAVGRYFEQMKEFREAQSLWSLELRACMIIGSKMTGVMPEQPTVPTQSPSEQELQEWLRRCRADPSSFRVITTFLTQRHATNHS